MNLLSSMAGRLKEIITFNPWAERNVVEPADEVASEEYALAPEYQEGWLDFLKPCCSRITSLVA
jgi:hypothetical protein